MPLGNAHNAIGGLITMMCPLNALDIDLKFEPTDVELLEQLAAKCGVRNGKPHPFIDEFFPTLDVDDQICSKHPENLPGEQSTYGLVGLIIFYSFSLNRLKHVYF